MKKLLYGFVFLVVFLTACSKDEPNSVKSDAETDHPQTVAEEQQEKDAITNDEHEPEVVEEVAEYVPKEVTYYEIKDPGRPLTELEQEFLRYPGIYSGDQYDEAKVNDALDQLPGDLTKEQYLEELKYLLTEDYHEELETLLHFDSSVDVDIERPDESVNTPTLKTAHYAILIDASGSMKAAAGGKTRMEVAKEAVYEFAEQVPEHATISMRVYGHKGSGSDADKKLSCSSTETFYNASFDHALFKQSLEKIKPAGWTPIALALEAVKEDIPDKTDEVIVYVVSDGIETCDGEPVKAAKDLVSQDIETVVNIIGFDVDNEGQKLLKEVASAGNGEFTYVNSERDLKQYMRAQYEAIQQAWLEWKETGKKQADEQKEEKKKLANETKESMKTKSDREKERMKKAQAYLKEKYADFGHPASLLFSSIVNYGNEKWKYAVDNGNKLWMESVNSGNQKWQEYVDEGNKKINETIDKKNQN